jgi:hypothetical protein
MMGHHFSIIDHMEQNAIKSLTIYWQGGEIMFLHPDGLSKLMI